LWRTRRRSGRRCDCCGWGDWTFEEDALCKVAVWKLIVEELSCKVHE